MSWYDSNPCNRDLCWDLFQIWIQLTHWGRDQMAAVSQTMFSKAFSWMKVYEFLFQLPWNVFLRFQLTIFQHWFRYWLGAVQATSHYLNQWWLVYWRIYASLGLNELKTYEWLSARLQYLQCISNGDTTVVYLAIVIICILTMGSMLISWWYDVK